MSEPSWVKEAKKDLSPRGDAESSGLMDKVIRALNITGGVTREALLPPVMAALNKDKELSTEEYGRNLWEAVKGAGRSTGEIGAAYGYDIPAPVGFASDVLLDLPISKVGKFLKPASAGLAKLGRMAHAKGFEDLTQALRGTASEGADIAKMLEAKPGSVWGQFSGTAKKRADVLQKAIEKRVGSNKAAIDTLEGLPIEQVGISQADIAKNIEDALRGDIRHYSSIGPEVAELKKSKESASEMLRASNSAKKEAISTLSETEKMMDAAEKTANKLAPKGKKANLTPRQQVELDNANEILNKGSQIREAAKIAADKKIAEAVDLLEQHNNLKAMDIIGPKAASDLAWTYRQKGKGFFEGNDALNTQGWAKSAGAAQEALLRKADEAIPQLGSQMRGTNKELAALIEAQPVAEKAANLRRFNKAPLSTFELGLMQKNPLLVGASKGEQLASAATKSPFMWTTSGKALQLGAKVPLAEQALIHAGSPWDIDRSRKETPEEEMLRLLGGQ